MKIRRMGRTGLKVSEICLGTMTFGHQCDERDLVRHPRPGRRGAASPSSTPPTSTRCRRRRRRPAAPRRSSATGSQGKRDRFVAGDQVPDSRRPRAQRRGAVAPAHPQGRRGQPAPAADRLHRPLPGAFARPRHAASRRPCGPSTTWSARARSATSAAPTIAAWQVALGLGVSDRLGLARFDCVQPRYNLLYREIEAELLPLCRDQGLGVIAYNPLAGGFLSGKYRSLETPPRRHALHPRQDRRAVPRALLARRPSCEAVEQLRAYFEPRGQVAGDGGGRLGAGPAGHHVGHRRRQPARATRRQPGRRRPDPGRRGRGGVQPRLVQLAAHRETAGLSRCVHDRKSCLKEFMDERWHHSGS